MPKTKTKAEKDHLNWCAGMGCSVCGAEEVQLHHIRLFGEPRDHMRVIPLCYLHHLGEEGIHFLGKNEFRKRYGHESEMLERLMETKP